MATKRKITVAPKKKLKKQTSVSLAKESKKIKIKSRMYNPGVKLTAPIKRK